MTSSSPESPTAHRDALEQRAIHRRAEYQKHVSYPAAISSAQRTTTTALRLWTTHRCLVQRYLLHAFVATMLPGALGLTSLYREPTPTPLSAPSETRTMPVSIVPSTLTVGDVGIDPAAFADIDALGHDASPTEQGLRTDLRQYLTVPATVRVESGNIRSGPGSHYDKIGNVSNGTALLLLAQAGQWFQAQSSDGSIGWVIAELVIVDASLVTLLPEATDIPPPPPPTIARVGEAHLNLRDGPATRYRTVRTLDANAQLDLLARYADWYQVQTEQGDVGWVRGDLLTIAPGVTERIEPVTTIPDPDPVLVGKISAHGVHLRSGPGTRYDTLATLRSGVQLDLLGQYDSWFQVRTSDGRTGWVAYAFIDASDYITRRVKTVSAIPPPRQSPASNAPRRPSDSSTSRSAPPALAAGSVVEYAMQFVGTPYVFGASGPDAFDCSGFTRYVYQQYGLNLPHSSAGQYSTAYGTIISDKEALAPGDLVFFANTYKKGISHVGIYIGNGNVVQAMSPELGLGVANIHSAYWSTHYYSAIRPTDQAVR